MLALIALAELLGMATWFAATAVAPQLASRWGVDAAATGWLSTAVQLGFVGGTALAALLNLADLLPSRWYFAASAVAAAIANAGLLVAPDFRTALLARALTGACLAGVYPPAMKMAATWFRDRRGLAIGTVVGALTIGKALPYLVHAMPHAGVPQVVLASSAAALLAALLIAMLYRDGPAPFSRHGFDAALVGAVLRDRQYRLVLGGYLGHMLELYAYWVWLPTFIAASVAAHDPTAVSAPGHIALLSFVVIAAGALGCIAGGEVADRIGHGRLVTGAMATSGACALASAVAFGGPIVPLIVLLLVWSVTVIADSAQFSTLVTRVVPAHSIGTALTLQTSLGFLVTTLSIQTIPLLARITGWRYALAVLAVGPVLGIAAIRRLPAAQREA